MFGRQFGVELDCAVAFSRRERGRFLSAVISSLWYGRGSRHAVDGAGLRIGSRLLSRLALIGLMHCGPAAEENSQPIVPPVDRESWEVELELHQPELRVSIQAAYVADDLSRHVARADSGVQVSFRSSVDERHTRLTAQRLTLEHQTDRISLGGDVELRAGDSLEVQADTLIWEGMDQRLWVPGILRITTLSGWERGRDLRTGFALEEWSMEEVTGRWSGREQGGDYDLEIQAKREVGRRVGGFAIVYDSVEVEYDGALIRSPWASFSEAEELLHFRQGVSGIDSTRRFVARELRAELGMQRLVARGGVEFTEAGDDSSGFALAADEVEEERRTGQLVARGDPAVFVQGERRIEAEQLSYGQNEEQLAAAGSVLFSEGERRLDAERLDYDRRRELLTAEGKLELQMPEFEGKMRCGALTYDLASGEGTLGEEPVLQREAEEGELEIRAGIMRFELESRILSGETPFSVAAGDLEVRADSGLYRAGEEQLALVGGVILRQERSDDEWRSRIQADSMVVQLEEGAVVWIELPEKVEGNIESSARRVTWIRGEQGKIHFAGERLERFDLERNADVTYRDLEREKISRFRGQKMELYFDAEGLRRAWIGGGARLVSRLLAEEEGGKVAANQVEGEELEILFEDGAIVQVQMEAEIEGRYVPEEK